MRRLRTLQISSLIIVSVLLLSTGSSFAQSTVPQNRLIGIYAQIVVRDLTGNLLAYLETDRVNVANPDVFNNLVDQHIDLFKRNVINVAGQDVEILQINKSRVHQLPTVVSLELITLNQTNGRSLVIADHDGYPVVPGDNVTIYWTITRYTS